MEESTEQTETTETTESFEGQDIPTTDEASITENNENTESYENTLDIHSDQTENDFEVPMTEDGDFDYENMTEEQLDTLIEELDQYKDEDGDSDEKSEYELPEKFKDVESLVKSYKMLESKVGNFKGAPETYEIDGVDMESEMMTELSKTAKELNMSNEAFSKFVTKHNEIQSQLNEIQIEKEMTALGPNAETRINNINNYIDNNMAPDIAEAIRGMATSSEAVRAIEAMIANSRPSGPATTATQAPAPQDINSLLNEKDAYGNLRMETDSAFNEKVMKLMHEQW